MDVDTLMDGIKDAAKDWDHSRPNEVSLGEFTDWYLTSEQRIDADLEKAFDRCDADGNGVLNRSEMGTVMTKMGNSPTQEELDSVWESLDVDHSGDVSKEEFIKWYRDSQYFEERFKLDEAQKEEEEGISLCPIPEGLASKVMYCITFPLVGGMMATMPDVRKASKKKYFVWTFFMAIVWVVSPRRNLPLLVIPVLNPRGCCVTTGRLLVPDGLVGHRGRLCVRHPRRRDGSDVPCRGYKCPGPPD